MAIDLKRIRKGTIRRPPRVIIYGFDGVGKTSFAAGAPDPFFLDANRGSHNLDVRRVDVTDWADVYEWLLAVEQGNVPCSTVVLDSLTDLEAMCHAYLFKDGTVTDYKGGYGRGDDAVAMEWRKLTSQLERVWNAGKAIVLTAHAKVKKFEDPTSGVGGGYERFELGCRPNLAAPLRQWCDYVFFAREEVLVATEKNKTARGKTTGARYIYTRRCPAFDAKARGSLLFPSRIELSWSAFDEAMEADLKREDRAASLRKEIDEMLTQINDSVFAEKVGAYIAKYPTKVVEAHNRVSVRLQDKLGNETESETEKESAA